MSCRGFPGLGTFGEQESCSWRLAGCARAGADKGLFVWILSDAGPLRGGRPAQTQ